MRIGIVYNAVDDQESARGHEFTSRTEIIDLLGKLSDVLAKEHDVIPIKVSLDIGKRVQSGGLDLIFNICEGYKGDSRGESWTASQFEMAGIPFTGSGSLALAICQDKAKTKQILEFKGIPTPRFQVFHTTSQNLVEGLSWPLIVKPLREDASEGIRSSSVVNNKLELNREVERIIEKHDQPAIVEEYVHGRELNIAVMGNWPCLEVLPISEITFDSGKDIPRIVDYDSKWVPGSPGFQGSHGVCPADLDKETKKVLVEMAKNIFRVLNLRDYARIDIRLKDGLPFVLEVNPNPGINTDSGFFRSASKAGMDYGSMIEQIIALAVKRCSLKEKRDTGSFELLSGRLTGRKVSVKDVPTILGWFNDRDTASQMDRPYRKYYLEELHDAFFLSGKDVHDLIFFRNDDNSPVGYCSVYDLDRSSGSAEISFLLGPDVEKGDRLGKEMVTRLVRHCFGGFGLKRLEATVLPENAASLRILKGLGFRKVGILRNRFFDGGSLKDEILMELLRCDPGKKAHSQ